MVRYNQIMGDVVSVESELIQKHLKERQARFDSQKAIASTFVKNRISIRQSLSSYSVEPQAEVYIESASSAAPDEYRPLIIIDPENSKIPISCAIGNKNRPVSITFPLKVMEDFDIFCTSREGLIPRLKTHSLKDVIDQSSGPSDSKIFGPYKVDLSGNHRLFKSAYILDYPPSNAQDPVLAGVVANTLRSFENRRGLYSHPLINEKYKNVKPGDRFITILGFIENNNGRPVNLIFVPKHGTST